MKLTLALTLATANATIHRGTFFVKSNKKYAFLSGFCLDFCLKLDCFQPLGPLILKATFPLWGSAREDRFLKMRELNKGNDSYYMTHADMTHTYFF